MGSLGKKLIALASVGAMVLPLGGCADKYSGDRVAYDSTNYSFTVDDGIKVDGEPYKDENGAVGTYNFDGKLFAELSVQGEYIHQLTAIATEKDNASSFKDDEKVRDVSWEEIKGAPYECAALHYKNTGYDEDEGQWVSEYLMTYQSRAFTVSARYKDKNKKAARAELERIVKSAKYTSDFRLPTTEQDYTCQLFNFHYGPQWMIERDREEDLANDSMVDIKFCYAQTDDPDQYLFPSAGIRIINNGGTENAFDLAGKQYDKNSQSSVLTDVTLTNEEFFGLDAEIVTYTLGTSDPPLIGKAYYMDLNEMVYVITTTVHEGSERDEQDVYDLLSGLTIFKLTDQEIEMIQQAREDARYYDDTLHGASFTMDGRMSNIATDSYADSRAHYSDYGRDLIIYVHESSLSPEEAAEATAEQEIANIEGDEDMDIGKAQIKVDSVTVGQYDMAEFSCIEPENYSHSYDETKRKYFLERDGELWEFEFTNYPDHQDEMTEFIELFFGSLKFE
ncbi:MAG: hypothetical protein IJ071_03770 [Ruminococcus sp.]|nr:hypothetical protein [Ruminococcus sp.]